MKSFKQRYSNILKELGMTEKEINRIIYKSKFYDAWNCDERSKLLEDFKLIKTFETEWNETWIADCCYGDDQYYFYKSEDNKIAFLHRNYMCGEGTDYWLYIA